MSSIRHLALGIRHSRFLLPALFAAVFLILFAPVLFTTKQLVPSHHDSDLAILFVPLRAFASEQLRAGHIPLWNPHIFCGSPFLGNFQSALLYPLTWLHLILPLAPAINWTIALEFFLAAYFTSLCCRYRGVGFVGSFVGGLAYALSGAFFLRLYAGHLVTIGTMTWMPLVLLAIDRILDTGSVAWSLTGALAVALMLLAGSPPNVYNTGLIFAVYAAVCIFHASQKLRAIVLILVMTLLPLGLAAAQILPGLRAGQEAVRAGGTTYAFASDGPLPPENILTLYSARIWGDDFHDQYSGRSYMWESSLFIGMATTILAAAGIVLAPARQKWPLAICAAIAFILGLGPYAHIGSFNLHRFLYDHFPMYNRFRTTGRFGYQFTLCFALLAATGIDHLQRAIAKSFWIGSSTLLVSLLMAIIAAFFHRNSPAFAQTEIAAATAAIVGVLLIFRKKSPHFATAIAAISVAELLIFAFHFRLVSNIVPDTPPKWANAMESLPPSQRVLHNTFEYASLGMIHNFDDIYGYDPVILKRYAQLLAYSQGQDPDTIDYAPQLDQPFPLLVFMRCRFLLISSHDGFQIFTTRTPPLPELQLIDTYRQMTDPHDILDTLSEEAFDFSTRVILETAPDPQPMIGTNSPGQADIVSRTTDSMEIRANLTRPVLLVISDAYSQDWQATPLGPTPQAPYKILPANYAFMAIPLAAGQHHFLLAYRPAAWTTGLRISAISLAAWTIAMIACLVRKIKASRGPIMTIATLSANQIPAE